MPPAPSLEQLIQTVEADATSAEPLAQLGTASAIAAELADRSDEVLTHFVEASRAAGHSWTEISAALGVSKQAAHKRFSLSDDQMLSRFTPRTTKALEDATRLAQELGHVEVHTDDLLLGLLESSESVAALVVRGAGLDPAAARTAVLAARPGEDGPIPPPPFGGVASEIVAASVKEALALGHNYVGTEHVLLSISSTDEEPTRSLLSEAGLTHAEIKAQVVKLLAGLAQPPQPPLA
jgi:hypothetical protein